MFSWISKGLLRLWGWKITGHYPSEVDKLVIAVAPHTSNWDFPVGVLVNSAGKYRANYVGKHTIFRWPFGIFFNTIEAPSPNEREHGCPCFLSESSRLSKRRKE